MAYKIPEKKLPVISVCVPVYNGGKFLQETLDSISNQSYGNIEIVIVDDNSTDTSSVIIKNYNCVKFKIVKHRNHSNIGLHANWEKCISLSSGDWIKFVFQDDILEEKCIEELILTAQKTKSSIICGRKLYFFSKNSTLRTTISYKHIELVNKRFTSDYEIISKTRVADFFMKYTLGNFLGEPSCFLIHKTIFTKYSGFNTELTQLLDYEFFARTTLNEGLAYSRSAYIYFRVHSDSETYRNKKDNSFRSRNIEYILMLLTIKNNEHYKNFIGFLKEKHLSSYLNSLIVYHSKLAYHLTKKNKKIKLIWQDAIKSHPEITEYAQQPLLKNLIIILTKSLWINILHTLILLKKQG